MGIISIVRTHHLEDCDIEGYKGIYSQWEIKTEGTYGVDVLKLCQEWCCKELYTKKEFMENLNYSLQHCNGKYRASFHQKSFYELESIDRKNKSWACTWIYTHRRVLQEYV